MLRALAHPIRWRIIEALGRQSICVCELAEQVGRTQPYVSQQLAVLRKAGLVRDVREGARTRYCLVEEECIQTMRSIRLMAQQLYDRGQNRRQGH